MTTITTSHPISLNVGDRIVFLNDPNRVRHRVFEVLSLTSAEVRPFRRPSRGYARHVRRQKQRERKS